MCVFCTGKLIWAHRTFFFSGCLRYWHCRFIELTKRQKKRKGGKKKLYGEYKKKRRGKKTESSESSYKYLSIFSVGQRCHTSSHIRTKFTWERMGYEIWLQDHGYVIVTVMKPKDSEEVRLCEQYTITMRSRQINLANRVIVHEKTSLKVALTVSRLQPPKKHTHIHAQHTPHNQWYRSENNFQSVWLTLKWQSEMKINN